MRFKKENIPNYLSLFRILLVPVYIFFFFGFAHFSVRDRGLFASGIVFLVAGLTDALDGFLARKFGWTSDVGKLLDPLADKMMELTATICLAVKFRGPFIVLAAIITVKEFLMVVGGYLIMSKSKVYVSSSWFGKMATLIWYTLICLVNFFPPIRDLVWFRDLLCVVLIAFMIFSFVMYLLSYSSQIKKTKDAIVQDTKQVLKK